MIAIGLEEFGPPHVLRPVQITEPRALSGQVRIRVAFASVNPTDLLLRAGGRTADLRYGAPWVPGMEAMGMIDQLGEGVGSRLAAGMDVIAIADPIAAPGAYAQWIVVPQESVVPLPPDVDPAAAASLAMSGLTAMLAIDHLNLPAGARVAVTGSGGVVGSYAVQIAASKGFVVIADSERARALGAAVVVERGAGFSAAVRASAPEGVDALVDTALIGADHLDVLAPGGSFIPLRAPLSGTTPPGVRVWWPRVSLALTDTDRLQRLAAMARQGMRLPDVTIVPAGEAHLAHESMESREGRRFALDLGGAS